VCFFRNKNVTMLMKTNCGKIIDWVNIMYKHLIKELDRWSKAHAIILKIKVKANPKKKHL
jgi:hypothetical protein